VIKDESVLSNPGDMHEKFVDEEETDLRREDISASCCEVGIIETVHRSQRKENQKNPFSHINQKKNLFLAASKKILRHLHNGIRIMITKFLVFPLPCIGHMLKRVWRDEEELRTKNQKDTFKKPIIKV